MAEKDVRTLKQQINDWFGQLKTERRTYEDFWTDIKDYIIPERGRFIKDKSSSDVNDGRMKDQKRINSEATRALKVMVNGMQSGLTSKARPWLNIESPDPKINNLPHVRLYLKEVTAALTRTFASSNIYNTFLSIYTELAGFGTAAMIVYEHPTKVLTSRSFTAGEFWISTNEYLEMDAFFAVNYLTVKQMVEWFGIDKVSGPVKRMYEQKQFEKRVEVIQAIIKDPDKLGLKVPNGMPIAEVFFEPGAPESDTKLLQIKGFRTWPVMVVRWDTVGTDDYGFSPSSDVISDIKGLQKMEQDSLQGIATVVKPPLQAPPEMQRRGINTSPGAITYVNNQNSSQPAIGSLYSIQPDIQAVEYKISQYTQRFRAYYYNDLFMAIASQDANRRTMTATEANLRNDEAFLILGPVLERIQYELLDPLVKRAVQLMYTAGLIDAPPEELIDSGFEVQYTSILSQAQKAVATARIDAGIGMIGRIAGIWPEARNKLKVNASVDDYWDAIGAPMDLLETEDAYNQKNQAEAEAMRAREQAEVGKTVAEGAKLVGDTNPDQLQQNLQAVGGIS